MDVGDRLKIQNLKFDGNQQVYVMCGPQVAETCGATNFKRVTFNQKTGEVTMNGSLYSGSRFLFGFDSPNKTTMYKKVDIVCK